MFAIPILLALLVDPRINGSLVWSGTPTNIINTVIGVYHKKKTTTTVCEIIIRLMRDTKLRQHTEH